MDFEALAAPTTPARSARGGGSSKTRAKLDGRTRRGTKGQPAADEDNTDDEWDDVDAPVDGRLTVVCYPACDEVTIDGVGYGPSPLFKVAVGPGAHRVVLKSWEPLQTKAIDVRIAGTEPVILRQAMGGDPSAL